MIDPKNEPSHRYRRLVATYSGGMFGLVVGTWVGSWWFVVLAFLLSVIALLIAAGRDEPDWPEVSGDGYTRKM